MKRILGILFLIFVVYVVGINVSWHIEDSKLSYPKDMQELSYSYLPNFNKERLAPKIVEVGDNLYFIGGDKSDGQFTIEVYDRKTKEIRLVSDNIPKRFVVSNVYKLLNENLLIILEDGIYEFNTKTEKFVLKQNIDSSFISSWALDNNTFLLFEKKFLTVDSRPTCRVRQLFYDYKKNSLEQLSKNNFTAPQSELEQKFNLYPYSVHVYEAADNKFLFLYADLNKYLKTTNVSQLIGDFVEIFDLKTKTILPANFNNYELKLKKISIFYDGKIIYYPNTNSYIYTDINLKKSYKLDENHKLYPHSYVGYDSTVLRFDDNTLLIFNPVQLRANDSSKSLGYILVYKFDLLHRTFNKIGYYPFHVFYFQSFKLNDTDILLSGGFTDDHSIESNPQKFKYDNIILHVK